jgi:hypothetical protein
MIIQYAKRLIRMEMEVEVMKEALDRFLSANSEKERAEAMEFYQKVLGQKKVS